MFILPAVPLAVALASAFVAAVTDVWKYRIYNALTWPLLASGLAYHSFMTSGTGFTVSILSACIGLGPMAALYLCGGLGAGDVKLMAGLGSWLGPATTAEVLLASWLAAGIYALAVILYNRVAPCPRVPTDARRPLQPMDPQPVVADEAGDRVSTALASPHRRRKMIPFGLMIFSGLLYTLIVAG